MRFWLGLEDTPRLLRPSGNPPAKRYGERALDESTARADDLALAGDDDGAATWRRITAAVIQLANKTPPGPVH
jgi:hypothetical protein